MSKYPVINLVKEAHFDVEASTDQLLGHMRCDFADGALANKFFPSVTMSDVQKHYQLDLKQIQTEVNNIMFEQFNTFQKVVDACHPATRIADDHNNLFGQGLTCDYWVRLIPARDDYNMYIKIYARKNIGGLVHD